MKAIMLRRVATGEQKLCVRDQFKKLVNVDPSLVKSIDLSKLLWTPGRGSWEVGIINWNPEAGTAAPPPEMLLSGEAIPIREYLKSNGVKCFYHFTDVRNLPSIKEHGGLFSWRHCLENKINIPFPGGDGLSRELDWRHGLENYVRLSFCDDHPMMFRLKRQGYRLALLSVRIDVACLEETMFSDMNATSECHNCGKGMDNLLKVNLDATRMHYVSRGSEFFRHHQAEILVKTHIPLEYIRRVA